MLERSIHHDVNDMQLGNSPKQPQTQNSLVIKRQAYVPPGEISISTILTTVSKKFSSGNLGLQSLQRLS